jgi:transposase
MALAIPNQNKEAFMFAHVTTQFVGGIDLHARKMRVCVMDKNGSIQIQKTIPCTLSDFSNAIKPYRDSITIGVESTFNWYWLIDGLEKLNIPCLLGHALYIKRMSGGKHKNDPTDARAIADLLRTNRFPLAYAYPAQMRSTRDLLRRRHFFVRKRAGTFTHMQITLNQNGFIKSFRNDVQRKCDRRSLITLTQDASVQHILSTDLDYIESLDTIIDQLNKTIIAQARSHNRKHFQLLQTIPGCGPITALTVLYETHTIRRFPSAQCYSSYCRVVRADNQSGGSSMGHSKNDKIGNPYLKWALSEIACQMLNNSTLVRGWYNKQLAVHGTGRAMARLRHKIAVAIYQMLNKDTVFDEYKFLGIQKSSDGEPLAQTGADSRTAIQRRRTDWETVRSTTEAKAKEDTPKTKRTKVPERLSLRKNGRRTVLKPTPSPVSQMEPSRTL